VPEMNDSHPAGNSDLATPSLLHQAALLRDTFKNWLVVGVVSLVALPGRLPPRRGWSRAGSIRLRFRTRRGQVLETEARNSWPVIEVFHGEYERPIGWESLRLVVDIGAHVGAFVCWAARRAPSARIVAFEPEPRNFADLKRNVERNALEERVELVNAAVGPSDGQIALFVQEGDRQLSSLVVEPGEAVTVRCMNLDQYIRTSLDGPIDLLKIDAEGAEWDILYSLREDTWARISRIVVEVHVFGGHGLREMEDLFQSRGYATHLSGQERGGYFEDAFTLWGERAA
jgi:FkbM family methyltransferase